MALELTPAEMRTAEQLAAKLEKRGRQWKWGRWALPPLAVALLGLALHGFSLAGKTPTSVVLSLSSEDESVTFRSLSAYDDERGEWHRVQTEQYLLLSGAVFSACVIPGVAAACWHCPSRDPVLAKLLRAHIDEARREAPTAQEGAVAEAGGGAERSAK